MRTAWMAAGIAVLATAWASPAFAHDSAAAEGGLETRITRVEQTLAERSAPSSRDIQSSVDAYLGSAGADPTLVGGPGTAGYDGGFWIRGGMFLLKINVTIQARYEAFRWNEEINEPRPGGDLSGFSVPRMTLKFSGDATCNIHYYLEHECGHAYRGGVGQILEKLPQAEVAGGTPAASAAIGDCREAWIEYDMCPALAVRMGLVRTATTRQLMTPPEMQQFVDVGMASAFLDLCYRTLYVSSGRGYTDRPRDYGVAIHGALGCDLAWSYLVTVTNGDGPTTRNILDATTNDNLAYSARVNWDVKGHMGYEEGALRQHSCEWVASVGAWAWAYTDITNDKSHTSNGDLLFWGVDAAAGWGGLSITSAYNSQTRRKATVASDDDSWSWFVQVGYLFPDTAWEVAARYGAYEFTTGSGPKSKFGATEFGGAINYYIDGHSDKLTLDASFISGDNNGNLLNDVYPGYWSTGSNDGMLLRFQWQLAL